MTHYDLGRSDDAAVVALFKGVNHWIASIDDADVLALHAWVATRDRAAGETVVSTIESLKKSGEEQLLHLALQVKDNSNEVLCLRLARGLLRSLRPEIDEVSSTVRMSSKAGSLNQLAVYLVEMSRPKAEKQ